MSKKVFISYRREDTADAAGRVYDRLWRVLSKPNVFYDVSTIHGGQDFIEKILSAIGRSDAALIFIGPNWLAPVQQTSKPRIWEENDYVRAEVRAVLARRILTLPVLVAGARMPKSEELPEDINAIATINALPLRRESFDDDAENIVATILGVSRKDRPWESKGSIWLKIAYGMGGAIVASVVVITGALVHRSILDRSLAESIGDAGTMLVLIASVIAGAWLGLAYEERKRALR